MTPPRADGHAEFHDTLTGGGEMGGLMRATDWRATPVGAPDTWPQSLRTAVSIVLESRFPMYIAWGPTFVQFYNDGYRPILGATKHPAALGRGARETFAESWHIIGPMFEGVRAGTAVGSDDWMLPLDRNGYLEECYFTFSYSPIRDESGGVGGVLVTVTETTARVLGERRLRALRELGARAGAARCEDDAWRGAAEALSGNGSDTPFALFYRFDERLAQPELVATAGWGGDGAALAAARARFAWPLAEPSAPASGELVTALRARYGALPGGPWPEAPESALVLPVALAGAERPYGFLVAGLSPRLALDDDYRGFLRLVADQIAAALANVRAYEDERRRAEALAEIDRAKTAFFSNVSHEFRTPLTLMLGPVEDGLADRDEPLPPAQRQRQELVRRNGLRLQKLVNSLLDFARIEAGRTQAAFAPTDLAALTIDLVSSFDSTFASAGLALHVDCPTLPEPVYVDVAMWEKVVLNLLSNAFKFTFQGRVHVALKWLGDGVILTVQDTGTGIPADELPRIFDRFHRVEGARGRSHEGTGIGLALVRELVHLHGGRVDVQSTLGRGSRFSVWLPTGAAHLRRDRVLPAARPLASTGLGPESFLAEAAQWNDVVPPGPRAAPRTFAPPPSPAAHHADARILVADDNADMRGYVTRLLSARWAVEAVSDGAQALAAAQARPPDLVLADVMMPGLDGLELARALRADARTRTVPVILLSARAGEESTIEGLESGADEYLVKPFSAGELRARVEALLTISRLRQDALRAERAHAEEAGRLLAAAQRATRLREDTLAIVSHDLRNPLSTINAAVELLERSLGEDERDRRPRRQTDAIRRAADRMNRLLDDLLDSASIDAGTLSLSPRAHTAEELVRDLREAFESQAAERGLALRVEIAPDLPAVRCDRERLHQVLSNLLSNALKFTPRGGTVRVRVERDARAHGVRFTVADDGPGIARETQAHIFDRYWHAAQPNREGHGLGLFIANGIVEAHGGRLEVASTPGAGSTFSFTLLEDGAPPAQRAALPSARPPATPARDGTEPAPHATPTNTADSFAQLGGEMGALIRAYDWSTTALGPMARWPQSLRTSVSTMLRSPYPITLFWGPELVMLYNDPFRPIHGDKHPEMLGTPAGEGLAEAWGVLGPLVAKTLASGEPLYVQDGLVIFARRPGGLKEESYFTWSYNPTIGESGEIAGLFAIASETTRQVVGDRRLGALRELSVRTAYDRNVDGVYRSVEAVLATAGADVPFALLYAVEADTARLVACTGVARDASAAPTTLALDAASAWPLADVARRGQEVLLEDLAARFGPLPGGPWAEPATRALLLHVPTGADAQATAVLIAGLSPLLALDDEYHSFLQLLARQISASLASARAYEQETLRATKLAELDRAKTDFFSNVSHEFRTPLTLILGPVEAALAEPGRSLHGDKLELVRRNALRLHRMVNTLLDFSRTEAGRAQAAFVPIDLAALTASLASHFQSAAEGAGLALVVDCPALPEPVYVDPEMWEKIVLNLLSNAIKYTLRGQVRVGLAWDDDAAVLTVRDTGVGIAEADLPRIFDRFYRARGTEGRSHEGTGIGLALVRELVELHGGRVAVASRLGEGTTFTVRMPRGADHLPAERVERTARPRAAAAAAAGPAAFVEEATRWSSQDATRAGAPSRESLDDATLVMPSPLVHSRILLVDDNADLRAYVGGLLSRVFANVEMATNGREALERARAAPPDLVLADVMMPVMDGFELVRALRADARTRSVPTILLSARAGDAATVEGLECGADDYLVKPFSARELVARVRTQLEMSRVRAEVWHERGHVAQLRRSVAARDEFIAVSSHELRTPLTALQIQVESALRLTERGAVTGREAGRVASKLAVALRQVDRLTRLVEALLDVSRISLGALELVPEDFDLAALAREVVARFETDARARGTSIRLDLAPAPGRWDRARVDQVLSSLLSNAVKYAPGTVIDLVVDTHDGAARAIVRDRGMGIPAEALTRVFDRFERGVSADSYGGLGLGLYLSRKLVEAHGGALVAERTPDRETTLTVTLPLAPQHDPASADGRGPTDLR